jgi:hypothetical protein
MWRNLLRARSVFASVWLKVEASIIEIVETSNSCVFLDYFNIVTLFSLFKTQIRLIVC